MNSSTWRWRSVKVAAATSVAGAVRAGAGVRTAALGRGLALTVLRAGAALGGSSPGIAERRPHVQTVVVQTGDTLWSLARRLAPRSDPRAVVDALVQARGSSTVVPGETITWLRP